MQNRPIEEAEFGEFIAAVKDNDIIKARNLLAALRSNSDENQLAERLNQKDADDKTVFQYLLAKDFIYANGVSEERFNLVEDLLGAGAKLGQSLLDYTRSSVGTRLEELERKSEQQRVEMQRRPEFFPGERDIPTVKEQVPEPTEKSAYLKKRVQIQEELPRQDPEKKIKKFSRLSEEYYQINFAKDVKEAFAKKYKSDKHSSDNKEHRYIKRDIEYGLYKDEIKKMANDESLPASIRGKAFFEIAMDYDRDVGDAKISSNPAKNTSKNLHDEDTQYSLRNKALVKAAELNNPQALFMLAKLRADRARGLIADGKSAMEVENEAITYFTKLTRYNLDVPAYRDMTATQKLEVMLVAKQALEHIGRHPDIKEKLYNSSRAHSVDGYQDFATRKERINGEIKTLKIEIYGKEGYLREKRAEKGTAYRVAMNLGDFLFAPVDKLLNKIEGKDNSKKDEQKQHKGKGKT